MSRIRGKDATPEKAVRSMEKAEECLSAEWGVQIQEAF
jgi:hypothetical protein